jgi:hypothetical protein
VVLGFHFELLEPRDIAKTNITCSSDDLKQDQFASVGCSDPDMSRSGFEIPVKVAIY